jgi:hypothetical protein
LLCKKLKGYLAMHTRLEDYEREKRAIRHKSTRAGDRQQEFDDFDLDLMESAQRKIGAGDLVQVGTRVIIGAGVGLLAGVATIAVVASAAEVVVGGVITKIAGVVGGAAGLSLGLRRIDSKKKRKKKEALRTTRLEE